MSPVNTTINFGLHKKFNNFLTDWLPSAFGEGLSLCS